MKIRDGFVTNSSSTDYLIALPKYKRLNILIGVLPRIAHTIEEVVENYIDWIECKCIAIECEGETREEFLIRSIPGCSKYGLDGSDWYHTRKEVGHMVELLKGGEYRVFWISVPYWTEASAREEVLKLLDDVDVIKYDIT